MEIEYYDTTEEKNGVIMRGMKRILDIVFESIDREKIIDYLFANKPDFVEAIPNKAKLNEQEKQESKDTSY